MNFLKKLALATSSDTIFQYPSLDSTYSDNFSMRCLYNLLKLKFSCPNQKLTQPTPALRKSSPVINWAPLVKTSLSIKTCNTNNTSQNNVHSSNDHLAGRSVLCVGGRIKLYPEYSQAIANSGGSFIAFHGDANDRLDQLSQLLEDADMIICPVDCVNHDAFFIVKHYCLHSGKPCVLLVRSEVDNFDIGVHMLATMATKETVN